MIDSHECVKTFNGNSKNAVEFEVLNGECNMRRSRKVSNYFVKINFLLFKD